VGSANFPYWQFVDTMYYYVHQLAAAIPPVVWTNAAHRNGVKMCIAVRRLRRLRRPGERKTLQRLRLSG
jgi:hypothetical protein